MARVLFMGSETFTAGTLIKVGEKMPELALCTPRLKDVTLHQLKGPMLLNFFPSIDTSVCAKSLKTFCQECSSLSGLKLFHLSCDLPFAMDRYIKEAELDASVLSCFRSELPQKLGIKIESGPLRGLSARAVILVDEEMIVRYVQLCEEISQEPDYRAAIEQALEIL